LSGMEETLESINMMQGILGTPLDEQSRHAVYAVLEEHELGSPGEPEKVDVNHITTICAGDWDWCKTVYTNLEETMVWAGKELGETAAVFLNVFCPY
jgi:hypothetical protein